MSLETKLSAALRKQVASPDGVAHTMAMEKLDKISEAIERGLSPVLYTLPPVDKPLTTAQFRKIAQTRIQPQSSRGNPSKYS